MATGIRRFAEAYGKPVIVYIKADNYIEPERWPRSRTTGS